MLHAENHYFISQREGLDKNQECKLVKQLFFFFHTRCLTNGYLMLAIHQLLLVHDPFHYHIFNEIEMNRITLISFTPSNFLHSMTTCPMVCPRFCNKLLWFRLKQTTICFKSDVLFLHIRMQCPAYPGQFMTADALAVFWKVINSYDIDHET